MAKILILCLKVNTILAMICGVAGAVGIILVAPQTTQEIQLTLVERMLSFWEYPRLLIFVLVLAVAGMYNAACMYLFRSPLRSEAKVHVLAYPFLAATIAWLKKNLKSISGAYMSPGSGCVDKKHFVGYVELVFGCLS